MNDSVSKNGDDVKEGDVIPKDNTANELEGITALLQGVVTPFAKAQEVSEQEATKRAGIFAGIASKAILALFGVSFFVLLLAGYALSQGSENMAEKMVIALIAFFGGLGARNISGK